MSFIIGPISYEVPADGTYHFHIKRLGDGYELYEGRNHPPDGTSAIPFESERDLRAHLRLGPTTNESFKSARSRLIRAWQNELQAAWDLSADRTPPPHEGHLWDWTGIAYITRMLNWCETILWPHAKVIQRTYFVGLIILTAIAFGFRLHQSGEVESAIETSGTVLNGMTLAIIANLDYEEGVKTHRRFSAAARAGYWAARSAVLISLGIVVNLVRS